MTKVSGKRPKGTGSKIHPKWKTKNFGKIKPKKRSGEKFIPAEIPGHGPSGCGPRSKCALPGPRTPNPVSGYIGPRKPKKAPGGFQMGDVGGAFVMGDVGTPFPMTKPPREEEEPLDDHTRPQYEPDWFGQIRRVPGTGGSGGRRPKRSGDLPFEY